MTYGGVTLDIDGNYLDGATAGAGGLVPDGTFVQDEIGPAIYRIAGGAPLLVSDWSTVGGQQPVTILTQAQFDGLNPVPADRTFLVTNTGSIFRVAGGAPFAVSSWSVFGGVRPSVAIDEWDIDNIADPAAHLRSAPADCTVVEGFPSRTYWLFTAGARSPTVPTAGAVGVDDVGLQAFAQGVPVSNCAPTPAVVVVQCVVPRLLHDTVGQAVRALRLAHCRLGKIHRPRHVARHHVLRIVAQNPRTGAKHSLKYKVAVTVR